MNLHNLENAFLCGLLKKYDCNGTCLSRYRETRKEQRPISIYYLPISQNERIEECRKTFLIYLQSEAVSFKVCKIPM